MAKTRKQPDKKKAAPEPVDVAKELAEALAEKKPPASSRYQTEPQRIPQTGERVLRPGSDTEYEITYVAPGNSYVNIGVPRTNFEWRNIDPATLTYLDAPRDSKPAKPPKQVFDVEEIREHVATVQHKTMDELSDELAILKKYLKSKRAPPEAAEDLDAFYKEQEEAWKAIVAKIAELLEE